MIDIELYKKSWPVGKSVQDAVWIRDGYEDNTKIGESYYIWRMWNPLYPNMTYFTVKLDEIEMPFPFLTFEEAAEFYYRNYKI